jgi:hypothetical protein
MIREKSEFDKRFMHRLTGQVGQRALLNADFMLQLPYFANISPNLRRFWFTFIDPAKICLPRVHIGLQAIPFHRPAGPRTSARTISSVG